MNNLTLMPNTNFINFKYIILSVEYMNDWMKIHEKPQNMKNNI